MTELNYRNTATYQKLYPEVEAVANVYMELNSSSINEEDLEKITQRICEERPEDSLDFWVYVSEIENMTGNDDWSDVNGCIENIINKYLEEKKAVKI